jgi:diguanylate cyclase (GGDEF)-like protein
MGRAQTMVLALLIMHFLLGGLCVAVARGERESPALRLWGWGLLVYAGGLLTTMVRFLPPPLMQTVGNAMIAFAPILSIEGVLSHTSHRLNRRWVFAALVATVLVLAAGNFFDGRYGTLINLAAPTPIAIVLYLIGAALLVRDPPAEAKNAAAFIASILVFAVAVWILRNAMMWNALDGVGDADRLDLLLALFVIAQIVVSVACTMSLFWIEVRKMEATLIRVAHSDVLTDLPNRRAIMARFREEVARAARLQQPLAMLVFDIDHFKQVNDTHGHLAGDAVLKNIAATLSAGKRSEDVLGRIGGEEFMLLLTHHSAKDARHLAERLREQVAAAVLEFEGKTISVHVSGGISAYRADGEDWDHLYAQADRRLYESKRNGRNRVTGP